MGFEELANASCGRTVVPPVASLTKSVKCLGLTLLDSLPPKAHLNCFARSNPLKTHTSFPQCPGNKLLCHISVIYRVGQAIPFLSAVVETLRSQTSQEPIVLPVFAVLDSHLNQINHRPVAAGEGDGQGLSPLPALTRSIPIAPLRPTPFSVPLGLQDFLYFLASPGVYTAASLLMFAMSPHRLARVDLRGAAR